MIAFRLQFNPCKKIIWLPIAVFWNVFFSCTTVQIAVNVMQVHKASIAGDSAVLAGQTACSSNLCITLKYINSVDLNRYIIKPDLLNISIGKSEGIREPYLSVFNVNISNCGSSWLEVFPGDIKLHCGSDAFAPYLFDSFIEKHPAHIYNTGKYYPLLYVHSARDNSASELGSNVIIAPNSSAGFFLLFPATAENKKDYD
ncbi:MAG TPA: hypothetical protein DC049_05975, partial [Spirochaetia bacterium]|nr:hypothetical protein [Spirochaetia bacterium]